MAALDANDITLSELKIRYENKKKIVTGKLAIAATDTYPTKGIPLPAISAFGFIRNMDSLVVTNSVGEPTTQYVFQYNKEGHKLQLFEEEGTAAGGPLLECDTSEAPGARTVWFEAQGW